MNKELINQAVKHTVQGDFDKAEEIYKNLLNDEPENHVLLSVIGLFYVNVGDYAKASEYLKKAYCLNKTQGTVSALGFAVYTQKKYKEAALYLEEALKYGENEEIYNELILSLFRLHKFEEAAYYANIMYNKYPKNTNAVANKVKALTQTGKLLEAEKLCVEYLREHNDAGSLWIHLGFLKELLYCDDKQACECFKIAAKLGHSEAYYNIAVSYQKQGDYEKAEAYYKNLYENNHQDNEIIVSYGMCLLKQKKFQQGYELFFKRKNPFWDEKFKHKWSPEEKFENNLVIISDQGYGDCIQFARYLPAIKEKTEHLTVAVRNSLRELFEINYPDIEFTSFEDNDYNAQTIRITDLAYALNMDFDHIPYKEGYLKAKTADIKSNKIKVGLCWEAGSAAIRTMINRTVNIKAFEPIFKLDNIQLYSFQLNDSFDGCKLYPEMINLAQNFKNFNDTAEAVNAMDVIISVDTSVAHLAGALGKKTLLLLPYASDWRWFNDTKITPWYDSIEIFKQTDGLNWNKPIEEIVCKLKEYSL